jgi:ribosomal protein RSM22 (predicted rRNA methylase)
MGCLNATVSPLLIETIRQLIDKEGCPRKKIVWAVAELSRLFTKERATLNRSYLDDQAYAMAYLSYFLPVNLAKIQVLLNEIPAPEVDQRFSVLDLGSGPGTGLLAVLDWWHQRESPHTLSVTAADSSARALKQARRLWDRHCQVVNHQVACLQTYV